MPYDPDGPRQRAPRLKKRITAKPLPKKPWRDEFTQHRAAQRDPDAPLTDKAWMMVRCYAAQEIPNQYQAYKMAGYSGRGQSGITSAHQIFNAPNFQKALKELMVKRAETFVVEGNKVVKNLDTMANANLQDYCEWTSHTVKLKPSVDLTRQQIYPIVEVREIKHKDGTSSVSVKLESRIRSNELLMMHLGLLDNDATRGANPKEKAREIKDLADEMYSSVPSAPAEQTLPVEEATPSDEAGE